MAWLCWALIAMPVLCVLHLVFSMLMTIALALQIDIVHPPARQWSPWKKLLAGLLGILISPPMMLLLGAPWMMITLLMLSCKILLSMVFNIEVGVLTFEVRLHRSLRPFVLN